MNNIIRIIGSIVFAIVMYCVPILFTCSILLHWHPFLVFLLLICTGLQLTALITAIYEKAEDDET